MHSLVLLKIHVYAAKSIFLDHILIGSEQWYCQKIDILRKMEDILMSYHEVDPAHQLLKPSLG